MAWDDSDEYDPYDEEQYDEDDSAVELPCPSCGQPVYEDADVCPHCGDYITPGRGPASRNLPRWVFVLGAIGVVGTILALILQ
ncbi:MAG: zinc ribbon domain-containing protein [Planctomycetota bacterium]